MKNFIRIVSGMFVASLCFAVVVLNVKLKPVTKPGQEELYVKLREMVLEPVHNKADPNKPKVVIDRRQVLFGRLPPNSTYNCDFLFKNEGTAPVVLRDGGSSCKCTMTELSAVRLQPGESHTVTVTFTTWDTAPVFAQHVRVLTTDPDNQEIDLWVRGEVVRTLALEPEGLGADLSPDEQTDASLRLVSEAWPNFEIVKMEPTSDLITCESLEGEKFDFRSGETHKIGYAQKFLVHLKAPPVFGTVTEKIRLFVKPPAEVGELDSVALGGLRVVDGLVELDVPITLSTKRRVNIYGPSISSDGVVELGKIFSGQSAGKIWNLVAKIRGDKIPDSMTLNVEGIDGIKGELIPNNSDPRSFVVRLFTESELSQGVHNAIGGAGKLTLRMQGLADQEVLELPIFLDVIEGRGRQ